MTNVRTGLEHVQLPQNAHYYAVHWDEMGEGFRWFAVLYRIDLDHPELRSIPSELGIAHGIVDAQGRLKSNSRATISCVDHGDVSWAERLIEQMRTVAAGIFDGGPNYRTHVIGGNHDEAVLAIETHCPWILTATARKKAHGSAEAA